MNKLLILILPLITLSCMSQAKIEIKRKIKVQKTDKGFEIRLAKHKYRVDRKDKIVIAVIDTGFNNKYEKDVKLCKNGNKSFIEGESIEDNHGHGTHIAGLIAKNIKVDYCIMVLKYYSAKSPDYVDTLTPSNKAFRWAIDHNVDMINYSGGGKKPIESERVLILEALSKNIIVVTAAGNESKDFKDQGYYPAMYDKRIIVVGNLMKNSKGKVIRAPSSNYGEQVDLQVFGTNIESVNGKMTGTSQSTAIVTGRIAKYVRSFRVTKELIRMNYESSANYYSPLDKYMRK